MAHQPDVIGVIAAHRLQRVRMVETARIELLPVGKAARHRVAANIDDPRVGQDGVDQPNLHPVVGHLVGEQGAVGRSADSAGVEIGFAEAAQLIGVERGEIILEPLVGARCSLANLAHQIGDVVEFGGALDRRMAGQYLFDQRRARSLHADNENRIARGCAAASAGGEKGRGEQGNILVHPLADHQRIIGGNGGAEAVALGIMSERLLRFAAIFIGLAECEIEPDQILYRHSGNSEARLHRRNVGVVEREGLEVGEAPP